MNFCIVATVVYSNLEHKKFKVKNSWAADFQTGLATFHYSALKISKPYAIFIQEEYSGDAHFPPLPVSPAGEACTESPLPSDGYADSPALQIEVLFATPISFFHLGNGWPDTSAGRILHHLSDMFSALYCLFHILSTPVSPFQYHSHSRMRVLKP